MRQDDSEVYQIRKKGALHKMIINRNGQTLTPKMFKQENKDPNSDGVYEGDYKGGQFVNAKEFLAPHFDEVEGRWNWSGTTQELADLIKKMNLRYEKGHDKEGKIIEPGDVEQRLTNIRDEVFTHNDLFGKYFLSENRGTLRGSDPRQKFILLCSKTNRFFDDKTENKDGEVSKFIRAGTKYEIISPRKENEKKKKDAGKEIKAIKALAAMDGDEDKIRAVCEIMDLPGYGSQTDINAAFVLLKDHAAQNSTFSRKYNKSYQDRFLELVQMETKDLNLQHKIVQAKSKGLVRFMNGHVLFNGEPIEGIMNMKQLIEFFSNPNNQDKYIELNDLLENAYTN